jgi:hypothetical protein
MVPSLRGVQRHQPLPGSCGQQQHFSQRLLLSANSTPRAHRPVRLNYADSSRLVNTSAEHAAASIQQPAAAQHMPAGSTTALPDDLTTAAEQALLHGNGLARAILSDPDLEGNPLAFLKATEAYWKVGARHAHVLMLAGLHCCALGRTVAASNRGTKTSTMAASLPMICVFGCICGCGGRQLSGCSVRFECKVLSVAMQLWPWHAAPNTIHTCALCPVVPASRQPAEPTGSTRSNCPASKLQTRSLLQQINSPATSAHLLHLQLMCDQYMQPGTTAVLIATAQTVGFTITA